MITIRSFFFLSGISSIVIFLFLSSPIYQKFGPQYVLVLLWAGINLPCIAFFLDGLFSEFNSIFTKKFETSFGAIIISIGATFMMIVIYTSQIETIATVYILNFQILLISTFKIVFCFKNNDVKMMLRILYLLDGLISLILDLIIWLTMLISVVFLFFLMHLIILLMGTTNMIYGLFWGKNNNKRVNDVK